MTNDEIRDLTLRLALEAGFDEESAGCLSGNTDDDPPLVVGEYPCGAQVMRLVRAAMAAERERCAKVCDNNASDYTREGAEVCAAEIRALGDDA